MVSLFLFNSSLLDQRRSPPECQAAEKSPAETSPPSGADGKQRRPVQLLSLSSPSWKSKGQKTSTSTPTNSILGSSAACSSIHLRYIHSVPSARRQHDSVERQMWFAMSQLFSHLHVPKQASSREGHLCKGFTLQGPSQETPRGNMCSAQTRRLGANLEASAVWRTKIAHTQKKKDMLMGKKLSLSFCFILDQF